MEDLSKKNLFEIFQIGAAELRKDHNIQTCSCHYEKDGTCIINVHAQDYETLENFIPLKWKQLQQEGKFVIKFVSKLPVAKKL